MDKSIWCQTLVYFLSLISTEKFVEKINLCLNLKSKFHYILKTWQSVGSQRPVIDFFRKNWNSQSTKKSLKQLNYWLLSKKKENYSLKRQDMQKKFCKFYPKRIIQKELSTNKSCEKYYPEELYENFLSKDLLDVSLLCDFI